MKSVGISASTIWDDSQRVRQRSCDSEGFGPGRRCDGRPASRGTGMRLGCIELDIWDCRGACEQTAVKKLALLQGEFLGK